jgi:hypothetical protein
MNALLPHASAMRLVRRGASTFAGAFPCGVVEDTVI